MTPKGQAGAQEPQPLQMSSCTTTVPNSVRNSEPVGHTSRQAASVQCLHTSDAISHRSSLAGETCSGPVPSRRAPTTWAPRGLRCSMKATCRHVSALKPLVLSYDQPLKSKPSSGTWFHSLHATSHALQPMHTLVSVKKPTRGPGAS